RLERRECECLVDVARQRVVLVGRQVGGVEAGDVRRPGGEDLLADTGWLDEAVLVVAAPDDAAVDAAVAGGAALGLDEPPHAATPTLPTAQAARSEQHFRARRLARFPNDMLMPFSEGNGYSGLQPHQGGPVLGKGVSVTTGHRVECDEEMEIIAGGFTEQDGTASGQRDASRQPLGRSLAL